MERLHEVGFEDGLHIYTLDFQESELQRWKSREPGSRDFLVGSIASSFIRDIVQTKATVRPERFFGEAYVAGVVLHEEGWYCSYHWLTSSAWTNDRENGDVFHREFKKNLNHYFPRLSELQPKARALAEQLGQKPMPPDLWLIVNGEHRFYEVKLPGDTLGKHQAAGLALLAKSLPSERPISVSVVYLHDSWSQFKDCLRRLPT